LNRYREASGAISAPGEIGKIRSEKNRARATGGGVKSIRSNDSATRFTSFNI
jgi:hypothetical protein